MTTLLHRRPARLGGPLLAAAVLLGALVPLSTADAAGPTRLVGLFQITSGHCSGGRITGSHLRMILPSGSVNGPYMSNADSPCSDQSFTPLGAGTDGGLSTVGYQAPPVPAFDSSGNARAGRITAPAQYYGTSFATATSAVDPQTRRSVPVPTVTLTGTTLSADLRSFSVSWNKQYFNQGSPKPDGTRPGNTRAATGTYDPATRRFTLDWASQVQGGPFDKFTGKWHLEGVFVPASGTTSGAGGTGTTAPGSSPQEGATGTGTSPGTGASSTVQPQGAGAGAPPGAPSVPGAPPSGDVPAAAPGATSPQAVAAASGPVVETVTHRSREWKVSAPLAGLAIAVAVIAVGLIIGTRLLERRAGTGRRSA